MLFAQNAVAAMAAMANKINDLPVGRSLVITKCSDGDILIESIDSETNNQGRKKTKEEIDLTEEDKMDKDGNKSDDSSTDIDDSPSYKKTRLFGGKKTMKMIDLTIDDDGSSDESTIDGKENEKPNANFFPRNKPKCPAKKGTKYHGRFETVSAEAPLSSAPRRSTRLNRKKAPSAFIKTETEGKQYAATSSNNHDATHLPAMEMEDDFSDDNEFSQQYCFHKRML